MAKEWSGRHLIYGSAGMAASGMMQSQGSSDADEEDSPALATTSNLPEFPEQFDKGDRRDSELRADFLTYE